MNISIQTEFNIGDRVWIPDICYDQWVIANKTGYIVCAIKINIDSNGQKISYIVNERNQECSSNFCFRSYEECCLWCEKENNGSN